MDLNKEQIAKKNLMSPPTVNTEYSDEDLLNIFEKGCVTPFELTINKKQVWDNYQLNLDEFKERKSHLKSYPTHAKVSITAACNVKCLFCKPVKEVKNKTARGEVFPTEKVKLNWLRIMSRLWQVELFREGESLTSKDFWKYASFSRNMGTRIITVSTNGMQVDKVNAEKFITLPLDILKYSVQGVTPEVVETIMVGAKIDKILNGMKLVRDFKNHYNVKTPKLQWSMVLNRMNYKELVKSVRVAAEMGFEDYTVHYIHIWGDEIKQLGFQNEDMKELEIEIAEAKKVARGTGINLKIPILDINKISNPSTRKDSHYLSSNCFWPWKNVELDASGVVLPCCGGYPAIGNLRNEKIEDIWNDPRYVALRKSLKTSKILSQCENCRYGFKPTKSIFQHITTASNDIIHLQFGKLMKRIIHKLR